MSLKSSSQCHQAVITARLRKQQRHRLSYGGILALAACWVSVPATAQQAPVPPVAANSPSTDVKVGVADLANQPPAPTAPQTPPAMTPEMQAKLAKVTFGRDPALYQHFDRWREKGVTTQFPGSIDSLLGDVGGFRSWLSDRDISFEGQVGPNAVYNILDNAKGLPRAYNGQTFTLPPAGLLLKAQFGLSSAGLPNSYIGLGVSAIGWTNFPQINGKSGSTQLLNAYYAQTIGDRLLVKAGYFPLLFDFAGVFTGGNPVLASGLSGLIPVQAGMTLPSSVTPAFELSYDLKNNLYIKGAVQRSLNPAGLVAATYSNPHSIKFLENSTGAKVLMVGEVGYNRPASMGTRRLWLRTGYIYNTSDYAVFGSTDKSDNQDFYILGDYQTLQPDPMLPYRGLYLGASAQVAAENVNVISQNYELRAYWLGPTDARPTDAISLTASFNKYSQDARRQFSGVGVRTESNQFSIGANYAYHIRPGLYATPSIAYIVHPSFTGKYADALNVGMMATLLF